MQELFSHIPDFPSYMVGNYGSIWNERLGVMMAPSKTQQGDLKVSLVNHKGRTTFSVRVLVAEAFCEVLTHDSDTVIVLNNNKEDVRWGNLAWRPRWFAWKYNRQFKRTFPETYYTIPVRNNGKDIIYKSVYDCATTEGLLMEDVWRSIHTSNSVYPSGDSYGFAESIW